MTDTTVETPAEGTDTDGNTRVGPLHQAHADWLLREKGVTVSAEQVFAIYSTRKAFRASDDYRKDLIGAKQAAQEEAQRVKEAAKAEKEKAKAEAQAAKEAEKEAKAKEREEAAKVKAAEKEAAAKAKAEEKAKKESEAKAKAEAAQSNGGKTGGKASKPTADQEQKAADAPF
jgi:hypothetical protein